MVHNIHDMFAFWQATLVRFATDDAEKRALYQYLAEASSKFPKVFPVVYNLLEPKVIEHLRYRWVNTLDIGEWMSAGYIVT